LLDERDELERLDDLALDPELRLELEFRPLEFRPPELRPLELCPLELRPLELRPLELRPLELRPLELRPLELRPLDDPPLDDRPRLPDPLWRAFFLEALSPSSPGSEWMSSNSEYSRRLS
jgi:hypothetical protein